MYTTVRGVPVFLHEEAEDRLRALALESEGPEFRVRSKILPGEARRAEALMDAYLDRLFVNDPARFEREWGRFRLVGPAARSAVRHLIHDFCHYHGFGELEPIPDLSSPASFVEALAFPSRLGALGLLKFRAPIREPRLASRFGTPRRFFEASIDVDRVARLYGGVSSFTCDLLDARLSFSTEGVVLVAEAREPASQRQQALIDLQSALVYAIECISEDLTGEARGQLSTVGRIGDQIGGEIAGATRETCKRTLGHLAMSEPVLAARCLVELRRRTWNTLRSDEGLDEEFNYAPRFGPG